LANCLGLGLEGYCLGPIPGKEEEKEKEEKGKGKVKGK
jgi:hypothetical protein